MDELVPKFKISAKSGMAPFFTILALYELFELYSDFETIVNEFLVSFLVTV